MPKWTALIQNLYTPTPVADSDDARRKVENKYEDIVHSSSGVLLLPSVPPLSEEQSSLLIAKVLTGVEQQSIIQEARNDRDRAIMEAKTYRDLAEKIKKEKREQECKQTEAVRDFWRNKVLEGDTRGGKILRASFRYLVEGTSIIIICPINKQHPQIITHVYIMTQGSTILYT